LAFVAAADLRRLRHLEPIGLVDDPQLDDRTPPTRRTTGPAIAQNASGLGVASHQRGARRQRILRAGRLCRLARLRVAAAEGRSGSNLPGRWLGVRTSVTMRPVRASGNPRSTSA
jgi:hypothetical protein